MAGDWIPKRTVCMIKKPNTLGLSKLSRNHRESFRTLESGNRAPRVLVWNRAPTGCDTAISPLRDKHAYASPRYTRLQRDPERLIASRTIPDTRQGRARSRNEVEAPCLRGQQSAALDMADAGCISRGTCTCKMRSDMRALANDWPAYFRCWPA